MIARKLKYFLFLQLSFSMLFVIFGICMFEFVILCASFISWEPSLLIEANAKLWDQVTWFSFRVCWMVCSGVAAIFWAITSDDIS